MIDGAQARRVAGEDNLRAYFERGLEIAPDLHFELVGVLLGVEGLTILHRRENGVLVADVATLNGDNQIVEYRAYDGPVLENN